MTNRLTLLVVYTVVTTFGCLAVPLAFTHDLGLGIGSVVVVLGSLLGVAITYRDIAEDLSTARQLSFETQANKPE